MKRKVLFVCIHNSARSQMAEAFLNQLGGDRFDAKSAGIEPGTMNPVVVEVMQEIGIDLSASTTKSVQSLIDANEPFDLVITVCDEASAERCPTFPGKVERLHWGFPDPSAITASPAEKLAQVRIIRDNIKAKIEAYLASP